MEGENCKESVIKKNRKASTLRRKKSNSVRNNEMLQIKRMEDLARITETIQMRERRYTFHPQKRRGKAGKSVIKKREKKTQREKKNLKGEELQLKMSLGCIPDLGTSIHT